ncbi:MAG: RdgB/HAM1 family non-canonical purine NTP pyrophosphatase [Deltaproteobacteria bacterium]|nr:RdgB/HAM1 family non-canonical purine NTP pyrophosphatase [Deltaproteobacteria bacterium]
MSGRPRLVFATRNRGKLVEMKELLGEIAEVIGVPELSGQIPEVAEDGVTFAENAVKKAREVARHSGLPTLADDSGLEVDALGGEPGVRSARYAGETANDEANNLKLLQKMLGIPRERRTARFRCVLAFADPLGALGERVLTSDGTVEGLVLEEPRGNRGFGYDPLFYSPELGLTFGEAGTGPKSGVSHRARAVHKMKDELARYFRLANEKQSG